VEHLVGGTEELDERPADDVGVEGLETGQDTVRGLGWFGERHPETVARRERLAGSEWPPWRQAVQDRVDTMLVYPHLGPSDLPPPRAVATVASGRRRVRLLLAALPFGFSTPVQRERGVSSWRELLAV
jgi:hypothetical protein